MDEPKTARFGSFRPFLIRVRAWLKRAAPFGAGVLATFIALVLYNLVFPAPRPLTQQEMNTTVQQLLASATPAPSYAEQVYAIIEPSLVLIRTQEIDEDGEVDSGLGSGVIINSAGDILTALHVVTGTQVISVTFADGTRSFGMIYLAQPENDIAVLKTEKLPDPLVPAVLGNPNAMRVGDEAFVVGHPFGLYGSMSAGVISGFNRHFKTSDSSYELEGLIQIDAAVNPGNSGGPLLNREGHVIGIVEGILNPDGREAFAGIGFAVTITNAISGFGSPPD